MAKACAAGTLPKWHKVPSTDTPDAITDTPDATMHGIDVTCLPPDATYLPSFGLLEKEGETPQRESLQSDWSFQEFGSQPNVDSGPEENYGSTIKNFCGEEQTYANAVPAEEEEEEPTLSRVLVDATKIASQKVAASRSSSGGLTKVERKKKELSHMKRKRMEHEVPVDALSFNSPPKIAATTAVTNRSGKAEVVGHKVNAFHKSVVEEFKNPEACRFRPEMDAQVRGLRSASHEVHQDDKQLEKLPAPEGSSSLAAQSYINQVYFSKSGYQIIEQRKKDGFPPPVPAGQPPPSASAPCIRVPLSMISGSNRVAEPMKPISGFLMPKTTDTEQVTEMKASLKQSLSTPTLVHAATEIAEQEKRASFMSFTQTLNRKPSKRFGSLLQNSLASLFAKRKSSIRISDELFSGHRKSNAVEFVERRSLHCSGGRQIERKVSRSTQIFSTGRSYRVSGGSRTLPPTDLTMPRK